MSLKVSDGNIVMNHSKYTVKILDLAKLFVKGKRLETIFLARLKTVGKKSIA